MISAKELERALLAKENAETIHVNCRLLQMTSVNSMDQGEPLTTGTLPMGA